jgi:hypothetical protein
MNWPAILRNAVVSGTGAAIAAAATAAGRAHAENSTPYAPLNAVTHCLWPEQALREQAPSLRYTVTGFAIHHLSGIFWGVLFESLRGNATRGTQPARVVAAAAATTATAYLVDYHVVPERFTPGFEAHLSGRSMALVYGALGAGFLLAAFASERRPGN